MLWHCARYKRKQRSRKDFCDTEIVSVLLFASFYHYTSSHCSKLSIYRSESASVYFALLIYKKSVILLNVFRKQSLKNGMKDPFLLYPKLITILVILFILFILSKHRVKVYNWGCVFLAPCIRILFEKLLVS